MSDNRRARFIAAWSRFCLDNRLLVLALTAAVTALAAVQLPQARFDNAMEVWFLEDDPALLSHKRLIDTFGSDELVLIGIEADDVFAPEVLATIDRMTNAIEKAPHVEKVFSLTNIEAINGRRDALEIGPLVELPVQAGQLAALRKRALANQLYVGNIVSAGGDFTAIVARLPHYRDTFDYKLEAVRAIREIMENEEHARLFLSGGPVIDEQFMHLSDADTKRTTAWMFVLLIVFLRLLLGSTTGVLLPLATIIIATLWAYAWPILAGVRLTMMSSLLPPLMLAVGVADSMHVLVEYQDCLRNGEDRRPALATVYRKLFGPLFLTSLTTSIGMLSLTVSRVQAIREFGVSAALGVSGAFLLSVTFLPALLSYLPARWIAVKGPKRGLRKGLLERLHGVTMRRGPAIVAVSLVLLALGLAGATRIRAESVFLEYFKEDQKIRLDTERFEQALSGTLTIEIMIDSGRENGLKDPEVLRAVSGLQDFLESDVEVSSSQSLADYFRDLRRAFFANRQSEYRLPKSAEEAAQYLLLYEMDAPDGDIYDYATYDYRQARVSARISMNSSSAATRLVDATQSYLAANLPGGITGTVTGVALLYSHMDDYIRQSLILGFSLALLAIYLVFCLQMHSPLLGAIAMIPNVVPIVICLGVMGFSGILLDVNTATVASIVIGLAVDDTVHLVSRVRQHLGAGREMNEALRRAMVEMGRALVYTSITLCAGFGVMMLGSFRGMIYFGLLCVITIAFALTADLLLLPVALRWYGRHRQLPALVRSAARVAAGE